MSKPRWLSTFVVFAGSLALAAPGLAHKANEFHFHIDPIVFEVLDVDVDTNSSKFNEYRDIQSGFNLPELHIFGDAPDASRSIDLRAEHVMRDDGRYTLSYDSWGQWGLLLDYNKIKHDFGNDGTLMWNETAPGVLQLPDPVQSYFQTSIAAGGTSFPFLNNLLQPFLATANKVDLGLQRDRTHARVDVKKMHKFGVAVDVQHESRSGIRPYAGSFGFNNSIELFEPTDYETTHAVVSAETTTERGGLRFGYRNSEFENDNTTLFWDNWMRATDQFIQGGVNNGSSRGFSDLAPDNDAGFFFLEGRYGFGRGWRVSGDVGYNTMEQDDPLLPYTLNTALRGVDHETGATFDPTLASNLPVSSADAEVDVLNFDVNVSKEFFDDLSLKFLYRYYDYDNQTPRTVFDGFVVFHSSWTSEPRITVPYAFTRDDLGAELDWEVTDRTNLGFSYHLKSYDREFREIDSSDEDLFKLSFDTHPSERFTIRASYEFGDRTIDDYLVEAQEFSFLEPGPVNQHPLLRKYDEAAREFDEWEASVYVFLTEAWNLNLGISSRDEDYDESYLGLISDEILQYSADLSYAPSETFGLYLFGHIADRESFQRDRQSGATPSTDPRDDWTVDLDEATDTAGLGFNGSPNDSWRWDLSGNWSRSDGDSDFASPPGGTGTSGASREPVDFDNYEDIELLALALQIDYSVNRRMDVGLFYRYEDYTIESFNLEGLRPYLPSTLLLVANDGDYQADVYGIRFKVNL
jgi:MtrB/PioB family decaheme-associated outer membrane protein